MKAAANRWPSKLSEEFAARLASIPAHETLHAVVFSRQANSAAPLTVILLGREERQSALCVVPAGLSWSIWTRSWRNGAVVASMMT